VISKGSLSQLCVAAERMAGTACGGMDQTISIFAELGRAKLIEFNPSLKAIDVRVPESVALVIANSVTPSPKLLTVGTRYNKRVAECRFGLIILALKTGKAESWAKCGFKTFYELQTALGFSFEQMLELVKEHLKKGGYSQDEVKKALNTGDLSMVLKDIPYFFEVLEQNKSFHLFERATHVFAEAARVYKFREVCEDGFMEDHEKVA